MIIDCHVHLTRGGGTVAERADGLVHFADKFRIDKLCLCLGPVGRGLVDRPSPEVFRDDNDKVFEATALHPDRFIGFCYVNPVHAKESLDEIDRCVADGGMRGIKLWCAVPCCDPRVEPVIERAIDLDVPVLQHTWLKITGNKEFESTPDDMATLAQKFPNAKLIFGHAGGDWEYGIKAIRRYPNVLIETAGGNPEAGFVEMAVREVGAERVVYGSDAAGRSYASQIAKVYGADISEDERVLILGKNMQKVLKL
ncbi:MAG: amidohydrolase family protein [Planctomycetes bacterium]|nr:amidohydrolase family protein [Planctomycetota bacterium]